jgi:hypothetical protein
LGRKSLAAEHVAALSLWKIGRVETRLQLLGGEHGFERVEIGVGA